MQSGNLQFLSPDKNLRSTVNAPLNNSDINLGYTSNQNSMYGSILSLNSNSYTTYTNSLNNWVDTNVLNSKSSYNLTLPLQHSPIYSNNPAWDGISYDKSSSFLSNDTPDILRGKEELAPSFIFNTY